MVAVERHEHLEFITSLLSQIHTCTDFCQIQGNEGKFNIFVEFSNEENLFDLSLPMLSIIVPIYTNFHVPLNGCNSKASNIVFPPLAGVSDIQPS